jgi:uncharacterized lipoprotein
MQKLILAFAAAALLSACALEPIPDAQVKEEKEYSTGSNLPKKDRTSTMSKEQVEQMQKGEGRSINSGAR